MEIFHSTFFGVNIYSHSISGMWIARYDGRKMADTLEGLKQLIRDARRARNAH